MKSPHVKTISALLTTLAAALFLPGPSPAAGASASWPKLLPVYDHVVIVLEENKDYDQVIGSAAAHYVNGTLKAEGADLTRMYAEEHYSEGNYFWLLSGSNQNIGFMDAIPDRRPARLPLPAPIWRSNSSAVASLSKVIPKTCRRSATRSRRRGLYARKHVPWVSFGNIPNGKTAVDSSHLRWADFPRTSRNCRR